MKTLIVLFSLLMSFTAARAEVVYSNLGPDNTFNTTTAWTALGSLAFPFVATGNGPLASVDAALESEGDPAAAMTVSLYTDNGGTLGTLLASSTDITTGTRLNPTLLDFHFSETPQLISGHTYWLDASSDTFWAWQFNNTGVDTTVYYNGSYIACSPVEDCPLGAFQVKAPEPATFSLLAIALVGMAVASIRRRSSDTAAT